VRRVALAGFAALALLAARGGSDPSGGQGARGDGWKGFPILVWFDGGPPPGPKSFAVLARNGLGGCNVEGSDDSAAARAAGIDFYVDHAAGKGDLFLRPKAFDADRAKLKESLADFRPARPNCFNDPAVMERLKKKVADSVKRHAGHAPLGWVLDDEISITRGVNPMDYCFGEECLAGLREVLRRDYGTVAKLNAAWGTKWRDFAAVVPPTTEEARRANDSLPIERASFAGWSDHRGFMRASFAKAVGELVEWARRCGARGPIGFTGGQFPSAFGGFEGDELVRGCTLVEAYEAGVAPELARAQLPPGGKLISTLFVPDDDRKRASWSPFELLRRAARGDDGAVIWSSGAIFGPAGDELNDAGRALAAAAAAADRLKQLLEGATPFAAAVALYENAASARGAWMLDSWGDGATWPNRLTSHEATHSSSATSRERWAAALSAASIPFRFVGPRELEAGAPAGVRCVVLHEAVALSDAEIGALERFASEGGLLLSDDHALLFDERLRGRDGSAWERLFGSKRSGGATLDRLSKEFDGAKGEGGDLVWRERALDRGAAVDLGRRMPRPEELREKLAARGIVSGPRLPLEVAGKLRLHRWRAAAKSEAASEGELVVVVATVAALAPIRTSLLFDDGGGDLELERLDPPGAGVERLAAGAALPIAVDDRHPFVARWRRAAPR
jgi:hypothetical protein